MSTSVGSVELTEPATLEVWDIVIIAVYFVVVMIVGLYVSKTCRPVQNKISFLTTVKIGSSASTNTKSVTLRASVDLVDNFKFHFT